MAIDLLEDASGPRVAALVGPNRARSGIPRALATFMTPLSFATKAEQVSMRLVISSIDPPVMLMVPSIYSSAIPKEATGISRLINSLASSA